MTTVKTLLCILTTASLSTHSTILNLTPSDNVFEKIIAKPGSKWSFNGGFFQDINNGLYLKNNGNYKIITKNTSDNLKVYSINISSSDNDEHKIVNSVLIDQSGPQLSYIWSNVVTKNNAIIAGPNSQLMWEYENKTLNNEVYINDQLIVNAASPIKIEEHFSKIEFSALDQFENRSKTEIFISTDFVGPTINWDIVSPKTKVNNNWYINNIANVKITADGAETLLIDGSPIQNTNTPISIKNNTQITAVDHLGNSTSELISWTEDIDQPYIIVNTLNNEYINPSKLNVKVNQKIQIIPMDKGSGILKSEYFRNNRKWLPLPMKIAFTKTGLYRFEVRSTDKIGNEIDHKIVFKITL